jgi:hypothetical protein
VKGTSKRKKGCRVGQVWIGKGRPNQVYRGNNWNVRHDKYFTTYELYGRKRFHLRGPREEQCTTAGTQSNYGCHHTQVVGNSCLLLFLIWSGQQVQFVKTDQRDPNCDQWKEFEFQAYICSDRYEPQE